MLGVLSVLLDKQRFRPLVFLKPDHLSHEPVKENMDEQMMSVSLYAREIHYCHMQRQGMQTIIHFFKKLEDLLININPVTMELLMIVEDIISKHFLYLDNTSHEHVNKIDEHHLEKEKLKESLMDNVVLLTI